MATIIRTSSGLWSAKVLTSAHASASRMFKRQAEAVDWARIVERKSGRSTPESPSDPSRFPDCMARYLAEVTPSKRPTTQVVERQRAKILARHFDAKPLFGITPADVAEYRDKRLAEHCQGFGQDTAKRLVSPSTVRLEIALLSHLFTTAIREWRLVGLQNPVKCVRRPRANPSRDRRLSTKELERIDRYLSERTNPMLSSAFRLALETGMRAREIRSLSVAQISLKRRVIHLSHTKNGCARAIPLSQLAMRVVQEAIARGRPPGCQLLFPGALKKDGSYGPFHIQFAWWRAKKVLRIKNFHFHDLRHEAISRMVEAGLSDIEVSSISGHKSMQMLKRYAHLRSERLVSRMDSLGFGVIRRHRTGK